MMSIVRFPNTYKQELPSNNSCKLSLSEATNRNLSLINQTDFPITIMTLKLNLHLPASTICLSSRFLLIYLHSVCVHEVSFNREQTPRNPSTCKLLIIIYTAATVNLLLHNTICVNNEKPLVAFVSCCFFDFTWAV